MCFLPEVLRGVRISDIGVSALDHCTPSEALHDEGLDAASTSHNFLTRGNSLHFLASPALVIRKNRMHEFSDDSSPSPGPEQSDNS